MSLSGDVSLLLIKRMKNNCFQIIPEGADIKNSAIKTGKVAVKNRKNAVNREFLDGDK